MRGSYLYCYVMCQFEPTVWRDTRSSLYRMKQSGSHFILELADPSLSRFPATVYRV